MKTLNNPGASTCAEESLQRVLHLYNKKSTGVVLVEQLPEGCLFKIKDGRTFQKGKKRTKRYACTELSTGKIYLFSAVYEVAPIVLQ